jgi:hypothetical protein
MDCSRDCGMFYLCLGLVAHISITLLDQLEGKLVQLLKIVRRVGDPHRIVTEPFDLRSD